MQPQDPQNQAPQPVQPQPAPIPTPTPAFQTPVQPIQPTVEATSVVPQPAVSAQAVTGMTPPTTANIEKQKKFALIAAIASLVILVVGLLFGYVFGAAAFLGAYAIAVGIRATPKPKLIIILGSIGLALNLGLYILSIVTK